MPARLLPIAVLHLDESCLGNGQEGATPGGSAGLIEVTSSRGIERRDFFLHHPDTIDFATRHSTGSTIPYAVWTGSLEGMPIVVPISHRPNGNDLASP